MDTIELSDVLLRSLELGAGTARTVIETKNGQSLLIPNGWQTKEVYTAPKPNPDYYKSSLKFSDLQSLVDYVGDFTDSFPHAKAYANARGITVILDDHGSLPGHRDFAPSFIPSLSEDWKRWMTTNEKGLSQVAFANHLEDNAEDIADPDGATMLEIVTTLQSTSTGVFKSGVELSNGNRQFVWEETNEAKAGKSGQLEVPREFKISVRLFEGIATKATITAKLRWRKDNGELRFFYKLIRPERAIELAMESYHTMFLECCPDIPLLQVA